MSTLVYRSTRPLPLLLLMMLIGGCATAPAPEPTTAAAAPVSLEVRVALVTVDGRTGRAMSWDEVVAATDTADVIIIGEQHDDAIGHAVQGALYEDIVARHPGSALSLEMLERDDQTVVDDYLDGIIDQPTFEKLTLSTGWGSWSAWYQPTIDAARDASAPVIAANAPRRYVRLVRTDGYDAVRALSSPRRELVDLPPDAADVDAYWGRFNETMGAMRGQDHGGTIDDAMIESMFRSQLVWDETMAGSITAALDTGAPKVVHLVGQFHGDFDGGTVLAIRRQRPGTRVLMVSLQPETAQALRDEDRDRGDVIIYTRE